MEAPRSFLPINRQELTILGAFQMPSYATDVEKADRVMTGEGSILTGNTKSGTTKSKGEYLSFLQLH